MLFFSRNFAAETTLLKGFIILRNEKQLFIYFPIILSSHYSVGVLKRSHRIKHNSYDYSRDKGLYTIGFC